MHIIIKYTLDLSTYNKTNLADTKMELIEFWYMLGINYI